MSEYAAEPSRPAGGESAPGQAPSPGAVRRRRRGRFGGPLEWLLVLLCLVGLAGGAALIFLYYGERDYGERIYPNISVRGLIVGNMTAGQARRALSRHYADFLRSPLELTYGGRSWRPGAEELGVSLDIEGALERAAAIGHGDERVDNARTIAATWQQGVELPLHVRIDQAAMQRYLLRIAQEAEQPPRDAELHLQGTQVVVTPEQFGVQVLVDETISDITAAIQGLSPQSAALRTRALTPRVRDSDVAPVIAELRTMMGGPIVLTYGEQRWEWSPEQIAGWVTLRRVETDGQAHYKVSLDQAAIRSTLGPIAAELREDGALPRVDWNNGVLVITRPGTAGRGLDAAAALSAVNEGLRGGAREIQLLLATTPPPVDETNLASLGVNTQIGVGVSSFSRSEAYRITNIIAGARRMHGVLVPPGTTFSFNETLGVVDASGGFVQGLAIVDNRTQKEWGGGLCQVSTTMFRAAFWAGLPITERHEHAFRIGWYEELGEPPGLDAAIFTPYNDVRFVNDSGGWLLLQSYVDLKRQRLTIAVYGPPLGREVAMDYRILARTAAPTRPVYVNDPKLPRGTFKRTDIRRGGLKVEVYRTVRASGAVLHQDTFATEFKPWPDIYVRGTGGR